VLENGVIISAALSSPEARFDIRTSQGSFAFMAQEILAGESKSYLDGKVSNKFLNRQPPILFYTATVDNSH